MRVLIKTETVGVCAGNHGGTSLYFNAGHNAGHWGPVVSDLDGGLTAVWQERIGVLEAAIQRTEATVVRTNEVIAQTESRLEASREILRRWTR
jgi:hypothetical protein